MFKDKINNKIHYQIQWKQNAIPPFFSDPLEVIINHQLLMNLEFLERMN